MAVTYTIDGHLNQNFYESDVWEDPAQRPFSMQPWSQVRGICREMIKGKRAPASFRFTLQLKPEYVGKTLSSGQALQPGTREAVCALVINIRMDEKGLQLVTGVAMQGFVMDKAPDRIWDQTMERFLASKGMEFTREG